MVAGIDWVSIKNEYVNTNTSYRKLAEKYHVSLPTVAKKSKEENWIEYRKQNLNNTCTKVIQKTAAVIVRKEVNRIERLTNVSDILLAKLEKAAEQLEDHVVNETCKTKTNTYVDESAVEITKEQKTLMTQKGIVKTNELKQIASALKDIKDIQSISNANDGQLDKLDEVLEKIEGEV